MPFVVRCLDKPKHEILRSEIRAAHIEYLRAHRDKILLAGPLLAEEGGQPIGSLLILNVATRKQLEHFLEADPYSKAGLFAHIDVHPWRQTFPS